MNRRHQRLTTRTVAALKPEGMPYERRDSELRGFLVRVQPSGVVTYWLEWKRGKRVKIGRHPAVTADMARERAMKIAAQVELGDVPEPKRGVAANTLRQFIEGAYQQEHGGRRGWAKTRQHLDAFGDLLDKKPADVSTLDVQRAVQGWRKPKDGGEPLAPATIARRVAALQSVFTTAVAERLAQANPAVPKTKRRTDGIRLDGFKNERVRYLDHDEEARLRQALAERDARKRTERISARKSRGGIYNEAHPEIPADRYPDHLTPIVLLALNTGLRRGELFLLRWADIKTHGGHTVLEVKAGNAKSGKGRHVPLNAEARAVLATWKAGADPAGLVFPGKEGEPLVDIKKAWAELLKAAGLTDFCFHDLRHSFASQLVMRGVDLNTVRELLGHADLKMTLRYSHLAPGHTAEAVERLARTAA